MLSAPSSCSRRLLFVALFGLLAAVAVRAEFEDLSNDEIEKLINTLDYMDYKRDDPSVPLNYDLDYEPGQLPLSGDYYDDSLPSDVEPLMQQQIRQAEFETHGSPFASSGAPVAHAQSAHAPGGTTKANPKNAGAVLPAYCDPPNPCPIGYTSKDGCLEDFENTSEFSRRYQAGQNCLCDSEHMFNCPMEEQGDQPRAQHEPFLAGMPPSLTSELEGDNPFLAGHKLPVAAKKGLGY